MDVAEFFEKYTETAAIGEMETEEGLLQSKNQALCFPSNADHTITFYLRNPKKFTLEPRYTFDTPDMPVNDADMEFVQDENDKSVVRLTFKQLFLRQREEMRELEYKDLSGTVSFYEPLSGRIFDSYRINLHANTAPPAILNPCFQLTSSGPDAEYIVCFYMPKIREVENRDGAANPIHSDTYDFYVNDQQLYINNDTTDTRIYRTRDDSGAAVRFTDVDPRFTTTAPSGMTSLEDGGFAFNSTNCPNGYIPMYFMTGLAPTTETTNITFTIRDDDGLSQSIAISNKAKQLNPPLYNVVNNQTCRADEDTGLYTIRITHDGLCTDDSPCGSGVTFNYTITETDGQQVFLGGTASTTTGRATGSAVINLPRGNYSITSTAFKNYYITSAASAVTNLAVRQPAIFYVRENGNNDDNGSRATPYRTINQAITDFKLGLGSHMYDADSDCEIRLLSDITPPDDYDFTAHNNAFVDISGAGFTSPVIIKGYGGQYTINANRSESSIGHVMYIGTGCNVTLNNLIIKGGYTSGADPSPDYDGAGIRSSGNLTATDCIIENNTALNTNEGGGGIWNGGRLNLTRCILRNNTNGLPENINDENEYFGSAILTNGVANDSCILTDCTITRNIGGPAISASRIFMIRGSITYNTSKNPSVCSGISFTSGTLDGVNISYNDFDESISADNRGTSGGGIHVSANASDGIDSIIKNCTIKNNKAAFGAGIKIFESSDADIIIEKCTITENTSYRSADQIAIGAGINAETQFTLKGKNTIYNNYLSDGRTQRNVYLSGNRVINIADDISGSTIGISKYYDSTTSYKPVVGTHNNFTSNYDYPTKNSKKPSEIFISENGYGITDNEGEAAFAVSSATSVNPLDYTFAPALEAGQTMNVYPGASKNFTLAAAVGNRLEADGTTRTTLYYNPTDKKLYDTSNHPDPSASQLTITAALYSDTRKVKDLTVSGLEVTLEATIPGTTSALPPGSYTLKLYTDFLGIKQETSIPLAINYSAEIAADYILSLSRPGNYSVKITGTVGPRMDISSETITNNDDGLAKVAKAIKSKKTSANDTGVRIDLDATGTSCIYDTTYPDNPLRNYRYAYFENCAALLSFKMPDWMEGVLPALFNNCSNLTSIEITASITDIYLEAFYGCGELSSITFKGTSDEWKHIFFDENWRTGVVKTNRVYCEGDGVYVSFGFFEVTLIRGGSSDEDSECISPVSGRGTEADPFVIDGSMTKVLYEADTDDGLIVNSPDLPAGIAHSLDHRTHKLEIDRSEFGSLPESGYWTKTITHSGNHTLYFKIMPAE